MDKTMNKNKQFNKNNKGKMQLNTVLRSARIREFNQLNTSFGVSVLPVTTNIQVFDDIAQRVFGVVDDFCDDVASINYQTNIDVDSLDTVELVMALEEEFDIEIAVGDAEKLETVGDIVDYIKNIYTD